MSKIKKRNVSMDISRAICMLWIVGVWHLQEYLVEKNSWNNPYTACITVSVLSMFTFISGYFLSGRTRKIGDCLQFYKKRLIRFYPLFFVSCISLFLASKFAGAAFFSNAQQMMFTLTGLSCFIKPYPVTLWYFAMLIFFYAITPFINGGGEKKKRFHIGYNLCYFDCEYYIWPNRCSYFNILSSLCGSIIIW